MNQQQIAELAPRLGAFLKEFRGCFATDCGFEHLGTYSRGLMSNLARKSVELIALAAGAAVRTLQEFLTFHGWDEQAVRDRLQGRLVARDMPAPSMLLDALGVIGLVDETGSVKKGTKTPGVQRAGGMTGNYFRQRRARTPRPPRAKSASVAGSGVMIAAPKSMPPITRWFSTTTWAPARTTFPPSPMVSVSRC